MSTRKVYKKYLYLIEKSIQNIYIIYNRKLYKKSVDLIEKVYMKCLYESLHEMSISSQKIYTKSVDLIKKSIQNINI